ncbi:MAG: universal stress protein [Nitrospirae bacterium]|nr:universal stress protein [Nitrospirota bacterium]MCL5977316.1 universal stress protein [Nitrospirota bacterium]
MKILVGHDGSEQAEKALKRALDAALLSKASIIVVSVVPDLCMMEISDDDCKKMYEIMTAEATKRLDALKGELAAKGITMETEVKFGNAADTILNIAKERGADMIVVGSHGRHGAKKFLLGSVSSKVIEHAACDVLVVK